MRHIIHSVSECVKMFSLPTNEEQVFKLIEPGSPILLVADLGGGPEGLDTPFKNIFCMRCVLKSVLSALLAVNSSSQLPTTKLTFSPLQYWIGWNCIQIFI